MYSGKMLLILSSLLLAQGVSAVAQTPTRTVPSKPSVAVDLAIADDETYKRPVSWSYATPPFSAPDVLLADDGVGAASRPGMSIAWRNAAQIEEVEVKVRNLGTEAAEGLVFVDITDETGRPLLHLEPPDELKTVRLPAVDRGGRDGKIIRMKASRELNNLIDRFDRARRRYDVTATIEPVGQDADLSNNSKTKSYNIAFRVTPGITNTYPYIIKNHSQTTHRVLWKHEHTPLPKQWKVSGVPVERAAFDFKPGAELRGTLLMHAPASIEEGAFLESRLSLIDAKSGRVIQQREWFQAYDTEPPDVSNYRVMFSPDHRLAIDALVADRGSGVLEATGVQTEYSTDGGRTWSVKAHNYNKGNFVTPTSFEAILGPFTQGTRIQIRFSARDTAGNVQSVLPTDAAGLVIPEAQVKLLDRSGLPGGSPTPIFELKGEDLARVDLKRITAPGDDLLSVTTLEVAVP